MNEIINAVFDYLDANLSVSVYDEVPQGTKIYPYLKIDWLSVTKIDQDDTIAFSGELQLVAYSQYRGKKELGDIELELINLLDRHKFANTASFGISGVTNIFSQILQLNDGKTRALTQRYEITFEPI